MSIPKQTDKLFVFVSLIALALIFFGFQNTVFGSEAATQRSSLLSAITTPQQLATARIAYFVLVPMVAAYFLYMNAKRKITIKEIKNNIGAKIGLVAGFLSIFVLQHQIGFYLVNIILMTTLGMWIHSKYGMNSIKAFLIAFIPAYYYMLVQIASTKPLELGSFFNAASVAVFIWVIPIAAALLTYALYRKYIPMLNLEVLK